MPFDASHLSSYHPKAEPVAYAAVVTAVLNAVVLLHWLSLSKDQITAIDIAVVAVLGLVVRSRVKPVK